MLVKKQKKSRTLLLGIASMIAIVGVVMTWFIVDSWFDRADGRILKLSQDQIQVVATIFPIADMAQQIVGDESVVFQLLPDSADPHTYSPTPEDILTLSQADVVVYLGDEQEPWVRSLLNTVNNPNLVVIDLGQLNFEHTDNDEGENHAGESVDSEGVNQVHDEAETGGAEYGEYDHSDEFHYWLDFELAQQALQMMAQGLSKAAPELAEKLVENSQAEQAKWAELEEQYLLGLQNCQTRTVVYAGHSAFEHLAEKYDLDWLDALTVSPDAELAPQTLAKMIQTLQREKILAVFTDVFFSPKLAETIAEESGLPVWRLNTGERRLSENGQNPNGGLLRIMEENLEKLQEGLGCE